MTKELLGKVIGTLEKIVETQSEAILAAAEKVAETLRRDGMIHIFGTGHSHLIAEEMYSRAGGLVPINAILEENLMLHAGPMKSSALERLEGYGQSLMNMQRFDKKDTFIIVSNTGRNPVPVQAAESVKKQGVPVIAITSVTASAGERSRVSSGKKLFDVADIVIDNCGVPGDASVEIGGLAVAPTSTMTGAFIIHAITAEAVKMLDAEGIKAPVFMSSNREGGDLHNFTLYQKYQGRVKF